MSGDWRCNPNTVGEYAHDSASQGGGMPPGGRLHSRQARVRERALIEGADGVRTIEMQISVRRSDVSC